MQITNWKLKNQNIDIPAQVPGDITIDHYNAGLVSDPYYGLNHKDLPKILDQDFTYYVSFDFKEKYDKEKEEVIIKFGGIDLFADIYLNGNLLGKADNMFLAYEFEVSKYIKAKNNLLEVKMTSTTRVMNSLDVKDYFGVFNVPRILIRKEQCGFGWDWAPNVPSYGIWEKVELFVRSKDRIIDTYYTTSLNGEFIIHTELNYFKRSGYDKYGTFIKVDTDYTKDILRISYSKTPNSDDYEVKEFNVSGNKNFFALKMEDVQLWWPVGYGKQPLYNYKVELIRDGKVLSTHIGKLAFRSVELVQKRLEDQVLSYTFKINGQEVYIKGTNWVPIDCFTGCIKDEKYIELIKKTKSANFNMLRIWGGGIYEKDIFFDTCDEQGMLVWQDFMFACADIPDDNESWVENAKKECIYQVKRLRNHPSLIYWCGGNEKTGSFGTMVTYGDNFVDVILRGIVANLDTTRPYGRQSPCALTDIGNDKTSGESHHNSCEQCLDNGVESYRSATSKTVVPFVSECAVLGPHSKQTFIKIFPQDKLWPMNEYWDDRLLDNPYAAIKLTFSQREKLFAEQLYGKTTDIDDFIKKGMQYHAEFLRCEIEFARAHKGYNSGILNWMYTDIWPTGTWAVVDYYLEPKQAYYQMAKSFAPLLLSFYQNKDGKTVLFGVNDGRKAKKVKFTYGLKDLEGNIIWKKKGVFKLDNLSSKELVVENQVKCNDSYLFVDYIDNGKMVTTLYSVDMWKTCNFSSDIEVKKQFIDKNTIELKVKANKFAKSVFINAPENCAINYSDNYFDIEKGKEKTVIMKVKDNFDIDSIEVKDYAK